jgi:hypothetical protein
MAAYVCMRVYVGVSWAQRVERYAGVRRLRVGCYTQKLHGARC